MTNNHCPKVPARAIKSRANEVAIRDFSEWVIDKITDFAEEFGMDHGIRISPDIIDSWLDCAKCESGVMEVHDKVSNSVISEVLAIIQDKLDS